MTIRSRLVRSGAAVAACGLLAAGCSPTSDNADDATPPSTPPTAQDYRFPTDRAGDYTFVWSAEPGIDLLGDEATLTRAAEEALRVAESVGNDATFPGYADSWGNRMREHSYFDYGPGGRGNHGVFQRTGTLYAHMMSLTPKGDGFTMKYCVDKLSSPQSVDSGATFMWEESTNDSHEVSATRIEGDTSTRKPRTTATDIRNAPNYNVFAGWELDWIGSNAHEDKLACGAWQRARHPEVAAMWQDLLPPPTTMPDPPPAPQPAYPGWPAAPEQ